MISDHMHVAVVGQMWSALLTISEQAQQKSIKLMTGEALIEQLMQLLLQ